MSLHIVLGFDGSHRHSAPEVIYCGRDADKAREASENAPHLITRWVRDPRGITKTNPRAAADADRARFGAGGGSENPLHAGAIVNPPPPPPPAPPAKPSAKKAKAKAAPAAPAPAAPEPEIGMVASLRKPR